MKKYIKYFSALSDETRLRIFLFLLKGKLCVCELTNILKMEQSRISHNLRILKESDLITGKREGRWIIYSASEENRESKFVSAIKSGLKLSEKDLKSFARIKKEKVRDKCKIKRLKRK